MRNSFGVAWRQLTYHKMKLAAAAAGVIVAVMLMLVQLGIREGVMDNSVAFTRRIDADLVVVSPRTKTIFQSAQFPRRLLYRLPADERVESVSEVYMGLARWKNKWENIEHPINVYGIDPRVLMIDLPGFAGQASRLQLSDYFMFDSLSRSTYGPVLTSLHDEGMVETEVNLRRVKVFDSMPVGVSITSDGNLYSSPANFLRLFPDRPPGSIDLGLVRLKSVADSGEDPEAYAESAKAALQSLLGTEAIVMTRDQLVESEINFLRECAPIDFIFGMGAVVGFFIGFVVVYQILYTEVTNHLPQLATMKAMGFTDSYLLRLVVWQALILTVLGYVPGFILAVALLEVAETQIQMPFAMTAQRATGVLLATVAMCCVSAMIAVRRAWAADPAEVF